MMTHKWLLMLLMLALSFGQQQAAPIICGTDEQANVKSSEVNGSTPKPSEVNQFLHNVQCTLEKAKPWIENLETEAKRLEETAKQVGLSILHRLGSLMESLLSTGPNRFLTAAGNFTKLTSSPDTVTNAIGTANLELEQLTLSTASPIGGLDPIEADNEIANEEPLKY